MGVNVKRMLNVYVSSCTIIKSEKNSIVKAFSHNINFITIALISSGYHSWDNFMKWHYGTFAPQKATLKLLKEKNGDIMW